ncbi:MAG TPA: hypothetical protein VKY19_22880 [Ktedonosporobacter sp.]|nr:hypothetical protein [Ktedonosporobacter sp.]
MLSIQFWLATLHEIEPELIVQGVELCARRATHACHVSIWNYA